MFSFVKDAIIVNEAYRGPNHRFHSWINHQNLQITLPSIKFDDVLSKLIVLY